VLETEEYLHSFLYSICDEIVYELLLFTLVREMEQDRTLLTKKKAGVCSHRRAHARFSIQNIPVEDKNILNTINLHMRN